MSDLSAAQVIAEETSSPLERASGFPPIQRGEHVLDRLAAAGYVVVKLPEDGEWGLAGDDWNTIGMYDVAVWNPGEVEVSYDATPGEPLSPAHARALAAALLAAANAAEQSS